MAGKLCCAKKRYEPSPSATNAGRITAESAEYRHVTLRGTFLNDEEVQIYTPADFGPAYWVLTPLP